MKVHSYYLLVTLTFLSVIVDSVSANCQNSPDNWYDSDGPTYNCAWYAQDNNCALYGNDPTYKNMGKTASQACCACGGGETPSASCTDSPQGWYDEDGPTYNCQWYSQGTNCQDHGDQYARLGKTANQACCVCGGGSSGTVTAPPTKAPTSSPTQAPTKPKGPAPTNPPTKTPTTSPTKAPTTSPTKAPTASPTKVPTSSPTSSPTKAPTNPTGPAPGPGPTTCTDSPVGWYDSDGEEYNCAWYAQGTNCAQYGDGYANQGKTANQACCACGGGVTGPAPAPPSPTPPSPTPPSPSPGPSPTITITSDGLQTGCDTAEFKNDKFNICLDLKDSRSSGKKAWMDSFGAAKAKWESVITGNLDNADFTGMTSPCGNMPASVDDIYICGKADTIDGVGGTLGSAGPTYVRTSTRLPSAGEMTFDTADLDQQMADGTLESLIIHEVGHVLGIGTLWDYGTNDLYTSGEFYKQNSKAQARWNDICPGGRLPVETDGGSGTAGGHWDEECLKDEVMTGYLGSTSGIFSAVTVGTLDDLGYTVDYNAAEPFGVSNLGTCKSTYCPTRRLKEKKGHLRALGQGNGHEIFSNNGNGHGHRNKKPISDTGKANMKQYATNEMKKLKHTPHEVPEGNIYVGGDILIVMYVEDGEFYSETFTWDDVKDD